MAGYCGRSMSNNAVDAYEKGEKPISKWKKKDIIEFIEKYSTENKINFSLDLLKKLNLETLKNNLLVKSANHHTSFRYNETEFFEVNTNILDTLTNEKIENLINNSK